MGKHFLKYSKATLHSAKNLRKEMTDAERRLWRLLRDRQLGVRFRRQVPFGKYVLDFLAIEAKLVVELDGSQHLTEDKRIYDSRRTAYLRRQGLTVLRFYNNDIIRNPSGVVQTIQKYIGSSLE